MIFAGGSPSCIAVIFAGGCVPDRSCVLLVAMLCVICKATSRKLSLGTLAVTVGHKRNVGCPLQEVVLFRFICVI